MLAKDRLGYFSAFSQQYEVLIIRLYTIEMVEKNENGSNIGFYLLPRAGREPSPPLPHHLQHRLSIIKEVSEESSAASTPLSSPKRKSLRQRRHADQKNSESAFHKNRGKESKNKSLTDWFHSDTAVTGDIQNLTGHQEIIIHTSGRGAGYTNHSSQR
jgi:hypothetical protein